MNLGAALGSSVGKKMLNAVTGLFFVAFVIGHLTGNFLLFVGPKAFNDYAYFLEHAFHGAALPIVELVMVVFLLVHAATGISVKINQGYARSKGYEEIGFAGGASNKTWSSLWMPYTGVLILLFIIFHVAHFKFGLADPRVAADQFVTVDGQSMKNLYGRVISAFAQPYFAGLYIVCMIVLGFHLWHGAWSAFQSLGLANKHFLPTFKKIGHALTVVLVIGFILLPGYIYVTNSTFMKKNQEYVQKYSPPIQSQDSSVAL